MPTKTKSIVALDVGARRVGIALADSIARLPRPLTTLVQSETIFSDIQKIVDDEDAESVIVGLPRDLNGQTTQQTRDTMAFVAKLKATTEVPVYFQDEAVTSKQAEAELNARGKNYTKADVDALAATYILEDFLRRSQEPIHG